MPNRGLHPPNSFIKLDTGSLAKDEVHRGLRQGGTQAVPIRTPDWQVGTLSRTRGHIHNTSFSSKYKWVQ
jgi:hypothetical protein